jgi:hypothetical protein
MKNEEARSRTSTSPLPNIALLYPLAFAMAAASNSRAARTLKHLGVAGKKSLAAVRFDHLNQFRDSSPTGLPGLIEHPLSP